MTDPITTILRKLTKYFDENFVPYVVVGGIAVLIFGRTRMTQDIDIILDHQKLNRGKFINYLQTEGFDANLSDLQSFDEGLHCSIFLKSSMFRVDIKGAYTSREKESIQESLTSEFNGIKVKVDHPENLIINKLIFGSEQDYEDALAVFIRNEEMIKEYKLEEKASKYNVREKLAEFLGEARDFINRKNDQTSIN